MSIQRLSLNFENPGQIEGALNTNMDIPDQYQPSDMWRLRYIPDQNGDTWQAAHITLARGGGDCEDLSRVVCGMLQREGHYARVRTARISRRLRHAICTSNVALPSPCCWPIAAYPFQVELAGPQDRYVYDLSWWGGMSCQPLFERKRLRVALLPSPPTEATEGVGEYETGAATPDSLVRSKLPAYAKRINGNPSWTWLYSVMFFETGGTFDPGIRNKLNGATGLIQFVSSTAKGMGFTLEQLGAMSFDQQMERAVVPYFNRIGKPMNTLTDVAAAVFWPAGVGRPGTVVGKRGEAPYDLNKGLDVNGDGILTIEEYVVKVQRIWDKNFYRSKDWYLTQVMELKPDSPIALMVAWMVDLRDRGIVPANQAASIQRWIDTVNKWLDQGLGTVQAVENKLGFSPKRWAEDKIRALFSFSREHKPTIEDYTDFASQTATEVKEAGKEVWSGAQYLVPAVAVIAVAGVLKQVLTPKKKGLFS